LGRLARFGNPVVIREVLHAFYTEVEVGVILILHATYPAPTSATYPAPHRLEWYLSFTRHTQPPRLWQLCMTKCFT